MDIYPLAPSESYSAVRRTHGHLGERKVSWEIRGHTPGTLNAMVPFCDPAADSAANDLRIHFGRNTVRQTFARATAIPRKIVKIVKT